jgi:hypothetical protein
MRYITRHRLAPVGGWFRFYPSRCSHLWCERLRAGIAAFGGSGIKYAGIKYFGIKYLILATRGSEAADTRARSAILATNISYFILHISCENICYRGI